MPKYNEPDSLKVTQDTLERHLREVKCPFSIIRNREFSESKKVLEGKARYLRNLGRGKTPNAAKAFTLQEEELLWQASKLGKSYALKYNVVATHSTLWAARQAGAPQHGCRRFRLSRDDNGLEFVAFRENATKTRQEGLHIKRRQQLPRMFATGKERCPVAFY